MKSKWVDYKFSREEERARQMWRQAVQEYSKIYDALGFFWIVLPTRQDFHKRLDKIEKHRHQDPPKIYDALGLSMMVSITRQDMHKRLDQRLDKIEKDRDKARQLFPEVADSFITTDLQSGPPI